MSRFMNSWRYFFLQATDASYDFAEASGLAILSTISLGRRWIDVGRGVNSNIYMMLTGESSVARKSTSVELAMKAISHVDDARVGPTDYTMEGLFRWMSEKDPGTNEIRNRVCLFSEEFGADLARRETYAATMSEDFCALYDGGDISKVRAKTGSFTLTRPRVSLFAGSAYMMLEKYLSSRDWYSGFLPRFLFVEPRRLRPKWTIQPAWPKASWDAAVLVSLKLLRDDLVLGRQTGSDGLSLDQQARALYDGFMYQLDAYVQGLGADTLLNVYIGRFSVQALKIALLYQIDIDPNVDIGAQAMTAAIDFCSQVCWPSFLNTFERTTARDFDTVLRGVQQAAQTPPLGTGHPGGVSRRELFLRYANSRVLNEVVAYLLRGGVIREQSMGSSKKDDAQFIWNRTT